MLRLSEFGINCTTHPTNVVQHIIMKHEGGYRIHHVAGDKGGLTWFGMNERNLIKELPGFFGIIKQNLGKSYTSNAARNLALEFYDREFVQKIRYDDVVFPINYMMLSFAINAGAGDAVIALQEAINNLRGKQHNYGPRTPKPLKTDGIFGTKTKRALTDWLSKTTLLRDRHGRKLLLKHEYHRLWLLHYAEQKQPKFMAGWINRTFFVE